jgi:hypothetical protein
LSRLAAVRWAFRCVASIITVSVAALAPASVAKIRRFGGRRRSGSSG